MESLDLNPALLLAPFVLVSLGFAAILWLAMLGGSLKLSLNLTVDNEPSYLRCLLMAILIVFINVGVAVAMFLALGPQPWYILACYQTMLQVALLMLLVRCNPFSACLASIAHSFFASIGTVAIAIVMFLVCGSALTGFKERTGEWSEDHQSTAATNDDGTSSNPFFTDTDASRR